MGDKDASRDRVVAELAARQHGVVSARQLRCAGIKPDAISRSVAAGRLHRVHRGVYAVGHVALATEARWMAAVLACPGAILSHRSAAALWGILPPASSPVDVTLPGLGGRRKRPGIRLHRSATLDLDQVTRRKRIPVTAPARTILDLRRTLSPKLVRRAVREAGVLRLEVPDRFGADLTRSELEDRFLAVCRRHRIPSPETNVVVGDHRVDFLWRDRRLVVETDGYRFHRGQAAFEDDRARDLELRLMGYDVLRFTYHQVTQRPAVVAAAVRKRLQAP